MTNPDDPHAASNPKPVSPEEVLRVLLGQASPEEAAAVRAALESDPTAARTAGILREIRDVVASLAAEAVDPPPPSLFERARALASRLPQPPSWLDRLKATVLTRIDAMAGGVAADIAGGLAPVPALRGGQQSTISSFAGSGLRLDVESTRGDDGSHVLRMQLDVADDAAAGANAIDAASLAGEFAVLDVRSGLVLASGTMSDDGAARVAVAAGAAPLGAVEVAVHCGGRAIVAAEVPLG